MPATSPWDKLRPTSHREKELRKIKDDGPASARSPADNTRPVLIHPHHYWSGGKGNSIVRTKVYEPVSSTFWSITGRSVGLTFTFPSFRLQETDLSRLHPPQLTNQRDVQPSAIADSSCFRRSATQPPTKFVPQKLLR
jgi:hypothetical protein